MVKPYYKTLNGRVHIAVILFLLSGIGITGYYLWQEVKYAF